MATIKFREFANVKRTAEIVLPFTTKKEKIMKQILELGIELRAINAQIDAHQEWVKKVSGGYTTEELVKRVVTPYMNEDGTQKVDKSGRPLTIAKIVPNTDIVTFDEDKRVYVVADKPEVVENTAVAGSDFDLDKK